MACRLILTADDFGQSEGVNAGVCALYDAGVVTSASLLVTGPAAREAVDLARCRPGLAVGLHLAAAGEPGLATAARRPLPQRPILAGFRYTLDPSARRALRRELASQVKAFAGLGFGPAHVDFHLHMGLTPAVFDLAVEVCTRFPVLGVRVPDDDFELYRRLDPADARRQRWTALGLRLLCGWQRRRARRAGWRSPDRCFGFFRSGRLDREYLVRLVAALPEGEFELHCHPDLSTPSGRAEFEALRSPEFRRALEARGVERITYADLGTARVPAPV